MTVRTHDYSMIPGRVDGAQLCGYPIDPAVDRRTEIEIRSSPRPGAVNVPLIQRL